VSNCRIRGRTRSGAGQGNAAGVNFMDIGVRQGHIWTECRTRKRWVSKCREGVAVGEASRTSRSSACDLGYSPGSYADMVVVPELPSTGAERSMIECCVDHDGWVTASHSRPLLSCATWRHWLSTRQPAESGFC